ncbi:MAG: AraC family transcriptional regulator, partial [Pseudomonadales bacterium]|nr:AraC family transcriptional regulator [Pseudomonadales bacterium]
CPVRFDQPDTVFAVSRETASRSLKLADVQSANLVEKTFAASRGPGLADTLISDLRKIFRQQRRLPDLSEAATLLSMSSRTLHRKLQMMGTNYLNEIELYRKDLACEMLRTSTRPITDIALRLGYYDSSAFSKAFKKWTGESPRTYKKRIES